jgi:site-specific DNA recombinase
MRVLGRLRLSVFTDESTSIERQREIIEQWASTNDHTIVGFASDIDVSGSIDPLETDEFGDWLNNRAPEFDIVCAWKLDRFGRNAIHLSKLFGWCLDHDKVLVSCSESIDLSNWAGRMLASVIAGLAEGELEAMRERQRGSRQKLRTDARWPGGRPPYGYRSVKADVGYRLQVDPDAAAVVERIVQAVIDGTGLARVARDLNHDGVRPPADHHRVTTGKQDTLGVWRQEPIKLMLQSPSLRGYAHLKGMTLRDDHGEPVRLVDPGLVTDDQWMLIQAQLARTQGTPRQRGESAPLAGVAACYFCGTMLTLTRQKQKYRYYRCPRACSSLIPADELETLFKETFLSDYGDDDVVERVWVPGDSRETDLREAVAALDELTVQLGRMTSTTAKQRLQRQLAATDARILELEQAPLSEARWEYRSTGQKNRDAYVNGTPTERRHLLKREGVTVKVGITGIDGRRSSINPGAWLFAIRSEGMKLGS